jgi:hypothetical protein
MGVHIWHRQLDPSKISEDVEPCVQKLAVGSKDPTISVLQILLSLLQAEDNWKHLKGLYPYETISPAFSAGWPYGRICIGTPRGKMMACVSHILP